MIKAGPAAALAAFFLPAAALAQATDDSGPKVLLESRLRSELVDQQGFAEQARALTLRARFGWRSPTVNDFQLLSEGEGVAVLDDRYSAPVDPVPGRPAVPDGETLELNRAQVRWTGLPGTEVAVGRQRLIVGNSRFIGNVGWRQNEQTFDAVRVSSSALEPVTTTWIYADRVQRPLGHEHPLGVWRGDIHMLQLEADTPVGRLAGFGLDIDLDNAAAMSSTTFGVRLTGSRPVGEGLSATWSGEYAVQTDTGANPADYRLDFFAAAVGLQSERWSVAAGYERFDGDGVSGFQTPLGTGHGYMGWSDVITTTPAFGVGDAFLRGSLNVPAFGRTVKLAAEAHVFHDADGDVRLGRELDLSASTPIDAHWSVEAKAARFESDHAAFPDTDKAWLSLEYRY